MSAAPPPPKPCPHCAMLVPSAARICPHCRKRLGTHPLTMGCAVLFGLVVVMAFIGNLSRPTSKPSNVTQLTAEERKHEAEVDARRQAEASAAGQREAEAYLKTPGGKVKAKHPDWPRNVCDTVAEHEIFIGMTTDQVAAAWGRPYRINSSIHRFGGVDQRHEQWVMHEYGSDYVYFENGIMTSLQQSK